MALRDAGGGNLWGNNLEGQLGDGAYGASIDEYSPVLVGTDTDWYSVSGGEDYSVALKSDGTLYHWGWNRNDRFIAGGTSPVLAPTRIGYQ